MLWYNDNTGTIQTMPPWGDGQVHPDLVADLYPGWSQVADDFKPPVPLATAQALKWSAVKAQRDKLEASGFTYLGKPLDSDQISVIRITVAVQAAQAALAANAPFSLDWTCQDDSTLTMTAAQVVGMSTALAMFSNDIHVHARELKAQIEAATTSDAVDAIPNW